MFGKFPVILVLVLGLCLPLWGCSGDPVAPAAGGASGSGVLEGEVTAGADFVYTSRTAGDPSLPLQGPFVIRGHNVHYDDALGVLVVDMTVENAGRVPHAEPIGLTFVRLAPQGVTVANPDNDEHGNGAAIVFQFDNDDDLWSPGEISLPRTVQFDVDPGTAIGFVARLDIGMEPQGGAIGGLVWHDADRNGEIDSGEEGIGGVEIVLIASGASDPTSTSMRRTTRTARDGTYRFDGLRPGFYTVMKASLRQYLPTTPSVWDVLLVATADGVSDFLLANFGCVPQDTPPPTPDIEVGDYVEVNGRYENDDSGGRVVARSIEVEPYDERLARPQVLRRGELRGTVTDINRERQVLAVMGTWVRFEEDGTTDGSNGDGSVRSGTDGSTDPDWGPVSKLRFEDVEIGDRVRVVVPGVPLDADQPLAGMSLREWNGPHDKVHGYVTRRGGPDGRPQQLVVLKTLIDVSPRTEIIVHEIR